MRQITRIPIEPKKIILCADDFGQNHAISEGILTLLQKKRINATSCLVNTDDWLSHSQCLLPHASDAFIGLHLNLTFGDALSESWQKCYGTSFKNLHWLILRSYARSLNKTALEEEIKTQVQKFIDAMGFFPHFIDGHEHIHQFPMIRDIILDLIASSSSADDFHQNKLIPALNFFCRSTAHHWYECLSIKAFPKRALITALGGLKFKKRLAKQHISTNTSFSGIYHFAKADQYRRYFQQFLQDSQTGGLIMCHPGIENHDTKDPLYQTRILEMRYFLSDFFLEDMAAANTELIEQSSVALMERSEIKV